MTKLFYFLSLIDKIIIFSKKETSLIEKIIILSLFLLKYNG